MLFLESKIEQTFDIRMVFLKHNFQVLSESDFIMYMTSAYE